MNGRRCRPWAATNEHHHIVPVILDSSMQQIFDVVGQYNVMLIEHTQRTKTERANGVQPGAWVVNGYGIAPAERASFTAPASAEPSGQKCYYVLDVLLCD